MNPPIVPAMALPIKFFCILVCTIAATVVFNVRCTVDFGMVASTTTDLPRPSIQLVAAAFLSVHILPDNATKVNSGNLFCNTSITAKEPFDTIFMPIASPAKHVKRKYTFFPATVGTQAFNFPNDVVDSNACFNVIKFSGSSHHTFNAAAWRADGNRTQGARVIPSRTITACAPPPSVMALAPRFVLATKHPSVVAMGMNMDCPFNVIGPTIPTGIGM